MRLWLLGVLVLAACDRSVQQDAPGDVRLDSAGHGAATRVAAPAPPDTAVVAAQRALDAGHPWQATRLLAPVLRDATQRTPEVVLLAARAAAGWEGWSEVDRLLRAESWVSNQFGGRGLELLARSSLERGADTLAATYAEAAVRIASDAATRARRLVYLGRALDRLNQRDSALAAYAAAAGQLREGSDWLLLRAAGVADDSTERDRLFVDVRRAVARERLAGTHALDRGRAGHLAGAATRYAQLGAMPSALRLRIALAADSAAREAL